MLLVIGYWLLVIAYWLLIIVIWLLVIGFCVLVIGYWLLVIGFCFCLLVKARTKKCCFCVLGGVQVPGIFGSYMNFFNLNITPTSSVGPETGTIIR